MRPDGGRGDRLAGDDVEVDVDAGADVVGEAGAEFGWYVVAPLLQRPYKQFRVLAPDPYGFDRDNDGIGCESCRCPLRWSA